MSDAETQPTSTNVEGAAKTISGLLNPTADTQETATETEKVTEETIEQTEDSFPAPSEIPNKNALSEEDNNDIPEESENVVEEAQEPLFPVTINGQKYEVNQEELLNGYQRQADYSRKTEELSIERKQQEDQLKGERESLQSQISNITQLEQSLRSQLDTEMQSIDFDKMYEEDPAGAARLQYQMQKRQRDLETTGQQLQKSQQDQFQKYLHEQEKQMYLKMPEMKDTEKATVVRNDMKRYLADTGYSSQEVSNLTDHRMLLILRDAMAYRRLQSSKPGINKKVSNAPRVVKAGTAKSKGEKFEIKRNEGLKRLKKSGSLRDAAAIFRQNLK
jgi:hypothetical protein